MTATSIFFISLVALVLSELIKGLSANGTPPLLQKLTWQLNLAHFMWTWIKLIRVLLFVGIVYAVYLSSEDDHFAMIVGAVLLMPLWALIFWVFNYFWVGKYKFLPITTKVFEKSDTNKVDTSLQVLGVDFNGKQKAFPMNMVCYHHQIVSDVADHPIWVTYCGMCRSGRIYDLNLADNKMEFGLVGAINFNAVFRDLETGSWWRQETGEAVKGPRAGTNLEDMQFEQVSLEDWLAKYPDSDILQYDPVFEKKYNFLARLFNYEASFPRWFMQETPPLVIGVEVDGLPRGYDWIELKNKKLLMDELNSKSLLLLTSESGASAYVYDRSIDGEIIDFELSDGVIKDTKTGSEWDQFGRCKAGEMEGKALEQLQSYQQYIRSWITFHPTSDFYDFNK